MRMRHGLAGDGHVGGIGNAALFTCVLLVMAVSVISVESQTAFETSSSTSSSTSHTTSMMTTAPVTASTESSKGTSISKISPILSTSVTTRPSVTSDSTNAHATSTDVVQSTTSSSTPSTETHDVNTTSESDSSTSSRPTSTTTTTTTTTAATTTTTSPTTTSPTITSSMSSSTVTSNPTGIIVGVVVGVGGFIVIATIIISAILIVYIRRHSTKKPHGSEHGNGNVDHIEIPERGTWGPDDIEKTPELPERLVTVENFLQYVAEHQNKMHLYHEEFRQLPGSKEATRGAALANAAYNRYVNILPYNFNRVELQTESHLENNFINASYINGVDTPNVYVATQGPMEGPVNTYGSFWHMIWDLHCERIAMVTNVVEDNKMKCGQYWPKNVTEPLRCGKFSVRLLDEHVDADFTIRKFSLHREGHNDYHVKQFHFTTWPDHGVPVTCTSLIKFQKLVFDTPSRPKTPVVVHCSAGVGRSGTLIALDYLLQSAASSKTVDVPKCVDGLRRQRMQMVQTVSQYIFLHHTLLEALWLKDVTIPCTHFAEKFDFMSLEDPSTGKSMIQLQYEVLDALKPKYTDVMYTIAHREANKPRNRSSLVLPVDNNRFSLFPVEEDDNTYVNAIIVDSPFKPKGPVFIVTQFPSSTTTSDFWRLVKDTGCIAIVMLNNLDPTNNNDERYWPSDGRTTMTGRFTIANTGPELTSDNVLTTNLKIIYEGKLKIDVRTVSQSSDDSDDDEGEENDEILTNNAVHSVVTEPVYANMALASDDEKPAFAVRHIQVLNWPNDQRLPADKKTLLTVYSQVMECLKKNPSGRILVHCLYGAERTGLFIAMTNMLHGLINQQQIDVFNAVKHIRLTRPEFIQNLEQYKYLFELAQTHLQTPNALPEPPVDYPLYVNTSEL